MRLFDGQLVESFAVRFGTFDIDDEDVEDFRDGEVLVLVMLATVEGAAIKPLASGNRKRTNNCVVQSMRVAKDEMRDTLADVFHLTTGNDQLPLDMPLPPSHVDVDRDTGEIPPELDEEDDPEQELTPAPRADIPPDMPRGAAGHDEALRSFMDEAATG